MTTLRMMGCKCSAVALLLALTGSATAQTGGQVRSSFVPRDGGTPAPATIKPPQMGPVIPVQGVIPEAKSVVPAQGVIPEAKPMIMRAPPGVESTYVRLDPPGRDKLFGTRDTEKQLEERMRQEAKDEGKVDTVVFPPTDSLSKEPYQPRQFAPAIAIREPSYVVYRRLYFEEKNAERNAWNLGFFQPAVSSLYYFKDVLFFPHNFASDLCRRFETNAGECWPGNSLPYMLYPPEFTLTGSAWETGLILGTLAILP